jgi:hypothetical protein
LLLGVVVIVAAGLALWTWWGGRSATPSAAPTPTASRPGPVLMTHGQLVVAAQATGHSVYWAGARGLSQYEATFGGGSFYIRYLPAGAAAGTSTPYLTVGTYERAAPYAQLISASQQSGAVGRQLRGGAFVLQPAGKPTSAYFAFRNANLLMEVFDPTPGKALALVVSGAVQPLK